MRLNELKKHDWVYLTMELMSIEINNPRFVSEGYDRNFLFIRRYTLETEAP